jgi:hypothetical protein
MPIRAGSRSATRTHPDGTSSRSATDLLAQLAQGRRSWGRFDEGERPEGVFDALLLELAIALKHNYR